MQSPEDSKLEAQQMYASYVANREAQRTQESLERRVRELEQDVVDLTEVIKAIISVISHD
jgi:hypothetical protein